MLRFRMFGFASGLNSDLQGATSMMKREHPPETLPRWMSRRGTARKVVASLRQC